MTFRILKQETKVMHSIGKGMRTEMIMYSIIFYINFASRKDR